MIDRADANPQDPRQASASAERKRAEKVGPAIEFQDERARQRARATTASLTTTILARATSAETRVTPRTYVQVL